MGKDLCEIHHRVNVLVMTYMVQIPLVITKDIPKVITICKPGIRGSSSDVAEESEEVIVGAEVEVIS